MLKQSTINPEAIRLTEHSRYLTDFDWYPTVDIPESTAALPGKSSSVLVGRTFFSYRRPTVLARNGFAIQLCGNMSVYDRSVSLSDAQLPVFASVEVIRRDTPGHPLNTTMGYEFERLGDVSPINVIATALQAYVSDPPYATYHERTIAA